MRELKIKNNALHESGFTLIELLIVIAIIGMLVAIGIPRYGQYLDRSEKTACIAELSSFRALVFSSSADPSADITEDDFDFQSCQIDDASETSASAISEYFLKGDGGPLTIQTTSREQEVYISSNGRIGLTLSDG